MSEAIKFYTDRDFVIVECCKCAVPIAVPQQRYQKLRESGESFWCINGHSQSYRTTTVDELKKQLENERKRREWAERGKELANAATNRACRSAASYKGKLKHVQAHLGGGLCPCCRRSFENLRRHMETKHPKYGKEE